MLKWELYTQEDRKIIEALIAKGQFDLITSAIIIDSPEKEYDLEKFLDEKREPSEPLDSKVKKEMEMKRAKGEEIKTPEEEAEWQSKLDAEKKEHAEKIKAKKAEKEAKKKALEEEKKVKKEKK